MRSDGLFRFNSICKFGSFSNPFATITSLPELYFRFRRFILLVQTKKVIFMNNGSSTSSCKLWRWVRLGPILTMKNIYISSNLNLLTKSTSSSRSNEFKDILPCNISQTSHKDRPNQHENSHKLWNKTENLVASLTESKRKLRQQHNLNFQMKKKILWSKY